MLIALLLALPLVTRAGGAGAACGIVIAEWLLLAARGAGVPSTAAFSVELARPLAWAFAATLPMALAVVGVRDESVARAAAGRRGAARRRARSRRRLAAGREADRRSPVSLVPPRRCSTLAARGGARRQPVVLYQPRDGTAAMPLGLLALGSWIEGRHVVIVDGRFELAPEARVVELARSALLIWVSVRTGEPLREALRVSRAARGASPGLPVIWGGPHVVGRSGVVLRDGGRGRLRPGAGEEPLKAPSRRCARAVRSASAAGLRSRAAAPIRTRAAADAAVAARPLLAARRGALLRGARGAPPRLRVEPRRARGSRLAGTAVGACRGRGARAGRPLPGAELCSRTRTSSPIRTARVAIAEGLLEAGARLAWRAGARAGDVLEAEPACCGGWPRADAGAWRSVRATSAASGCSRPAPGSAARRHRRAFRLRGRRAGRAWREPRERRLHGARAVRDGQPLRDADPQAARCARAGSARPPARGVGGVRKEPWRDGIAERRLARAAFYFAEAQRTPGRRLGKHLLRVLALLARAAGFFAFDFEQVAVELSALLRTGTGAAEAGDRGETGIMPASRCGLMRRAPRDLAGDGSRRRTRSRTAGAAAGHGRARGQGGERGVRLQAATRWGCLLLSLDGRHLRFIAPRRFAELGTIPTNKRDSIAVNVLARRTGEVINNVPMVKHVSFFESIKLRDKPLPIQKMVTTLLVVKGQPVGVAEISRKGETIRDAGADFTAADLRHAQEIFDRIAPSPGRSAPARLLDTQGGSMRSRRGTVALAFLALTLALSSGGPVRAQAPAPASTPRPAGLLCRRPFPLLHVPHRRPDRRSGAAQDGARQGGLGSSRPTRWRTTPSSRPRAGPTRTSACSPSSSAGCAARSGDTAAAAEAAAPRLVDEADLAGVVDDERPPDRGLGHGLRAETVGLDREAEGVARALEAGRVHRYVEHEQPRIVQLLERAPLAVAAVVGLLEPSSGGAAWPPRGAPGS